MNLLKTGRYPEADKAIQHSPNMLPAVSERYYKLTNNSFVVLSELQEPGEDMAYSLCLFQGKLKDIDNTNIWAGNYFELETTFKPAVVERRLQELLLTFK